MRPKISSESRSLLIDQLKARHSSQHRRLDELSTRLEETRKDNRRLQLLIVLLAPSGRRGSSLYLFRGYFHLPSPAAKPDVKPAGAAPDSKPGAPQPDGAPPPKTPKAAGIPEWRLDIGNRPAMALIQGCELRRKMMSSAAGRENASLGLR